MNCIFKQSYVTQKMEHFAVKWKMADERCLTQGDWVAQWKGKQASMSWTSSCYDKITETGK